MNNTLDALTKKSNNLQLLRFIAAVMVVCSHAFVLVNGDGKDEWFVKLTNGQMTMGAFAVSIFFCAGGYLIAKSVEKSRTGKLFFTKRLKKLFPMLWVVVVICVFALGPLFTSYTLLDYFCDKETYKYLLNGFLILFHQLPGVFEKNPYTATVNGSLWTLPVEFLCYVGCFIMFKLGLFEKRKCIAVTLGVIFIYFFSTWYVIPMLGLGAFLSALNAVMLFYIGIVFFVFKDNIIIESRTALCFLLLLIICTKIGQMNIGWILFFPYLLFYLCFYVKQVTNKISWLGNLSYGIYLIAFPIQQALIQCVNGRISPIENIVFSMPVILGVSLILYHVVEKKFARY